MSGLRLRWRHFILVVHGSTADHREHAEYASNALPKPLAFLALQRS